MKNKIEVDEVELVLPVSTATANGIKDSQKSSEKSSETGSETGSETSSETRDLIIEILAQNPRVTVAEIAMKLNISSRGIEKQIRKLREAGTIKRVGGRYGGHWEIIG